MNHDPLCPLTEPCGPDSYRHGFCSYQQEHCIHCYRDCACDLIKKVRIDAKNRAANRVAAVSSYDSNKHPFGVVPVVKAVVAARNDEMNDVASPVGWDEYIKHHPTCPVVEGFDDCRCEIANALEIAERARKRGYAAAVRDARNEAASALLAIDTYLSPEEHNSVIEAIEALADGSLTSRRVTEPEQSPAQAR